MKAAKLCFYLLFATIFTLAIAGGDEVAKEKRATYPGTHYCGPGDTGNKKGAKLAEVDNCCKKHDRCPISIAKGATKYGLKNTGLYTRCSCTCDADLRKCLKDVGGFHATAVRKAFDLFGPLQCIKKTTTKKCVKWSGSKCLIYKSQDIYSFEPSR